MDPSEGSDRPKHSGHARRAVPDRCAVMGHEIRGPVGVATTLTEMLLARDLDPEDRRLVELIRLACQQALGTAEDLVAEASLSAGSLRIRAEGFDPATTARRLVDLWSPLAEGKARRVELDLDGTAPSTVRSDEGRVRQILFNLVSNAIRHAEAGPIRLRVSGSPTEVVFEVTDGGGAEPVPTAPAPFRTGSSTAAPGAGLGLWICRQLADSLAGRLEIDAADGGGTRARLVLPVETPDRPPPGGPRRRGKPDRRKADSRPIRLPAPVTFPAGVGRGGPAGPLAGLEALVVDDSNVSRMLMTAILTSFDMAVSTVGSGEEAEALLETGRPDVILLDWSLPGETGADLVARLAARLGRDLPPVVVVSAEDRLPSIEAVVGHVTKPFSPRELHTALVAALPRTAKARSAG